MPEMRAVTLRITPAMYEFLLNAARTRWQDGGDDLVVEAEAFDRLMAAMVKETP